MFSATFFGYIVNSQITPLALFDLPSFFGPLMA